MQAGNEAEARVLTQQADLMRKVRRWKQLDAVRRAHKGSFIGVVNFGLAGGYGDAQFAADMTGLAPNFKPGALPGLLSKVLAPEPAPSSLRTSLSPAHTLRSHCWGLDAEVARPCTHGKVRGRLPLGGRCASASHQTREHPRSHLGCAEASFDNFKNAAEMPWKGAISVNPAFAGASLEGYQIIEELTHRAAEIECASYIGLVTFRLAPGYSEQRFMNDMPALKDAFRPGALPGLLSKRWLKDGKGTFGGLYLWKDEASFCEFKDRGPWAGAISVNPNFADATLRGFKVHTDLTAASEGQ